MAIHQKKDYLERHFEELGKVLAIMLSQLLDKDPPQQEQGIHWEKIENGLRILGLLDDPTDNKAPSTEKLSGFSTIELQNMLNSLKKLKVSTEVDALKLEVAISTLSSYLAKERNYADWTDLL